MSHFEFFGIPFDLFPDEKQIKAEFYALSKRFHPDINRTASAEDHLALLQQSARVNEAYNVLINFDVRLSYIVELWAGNDENAQLAPSFLMDMMELNELVDEAQEDSHRRQEVHKNFMKREETLMQTISDIWNALDSSQPTANQIKELKNAYYERKYLLRIREKLDSFAD